MKRRCMEFEIVSHLDTYTVVVSMTGVLIYHWIRITNKHSKMAWFIDLYDCVSMP